MSSGAARRSSLTLAAGLFVIWLLLFVAAMIYGPVGERWRTAFWLLLGAVFVERCIDRLVRNARSGRPVAHTEKGERR